MLACASAALLPACSAVKLAYNQAPDLAYWWLDGYFDLNDAQTPKTRDAITKLFVWHRTSELPKVANLLQKSQGLVAGEVSSAQVCGVFDEARSLALAVVDRALPLAAELAPTFTPDQLAHLQRKYIKINDEFTADHMTGNVLERNAKRLKTAISRFEKVYGKLEVVQISAIERAVAASSFDPALALKERTQRQKEVLDMLANLAANKATIPAAQTALLAYLTRTLRSPDPAYRAYSEKMVKESCDAFAAVHASTTPAQRAQAAQTLKGYMQDARTLAAQ